MRGSIRELCSSKHEDSGNKIHNVSGMPFSRNVLFFLYTQCTRPPCRGYHSGEAVTWLYYHPTRLTQDLAFVAFSTLLLFMPRGLILTISPMGRSLGDHGARSSDRSISNRLMNPSAWCVCTGPCMNTISISTCPVSGSSAVMPPNLYFSYQ